MANKMGLAGLVLTFLLAPQISQAPIARYFNPPKSTLKIESSIDNYMKESEAKFEVMKKAYEQRLIEERKRLIEERRKEEEARGYKTDSFWMDSDELLLARLVFGEGEGCPLSERIKIAHTALNRLDRGYARTLKEVMLTPNQYSAFNPDKDSYKYLKYPLAHGEEEFLISLKVARGVLDGTYKDPTNGATHYFNVNHRDLRGRIPSWARAMEILPREKGEFHVFCRDKKI